MDEEARRDGGSGGKHMCIVWYVYAILIISTVIL